MKNIVFVKQHSNVPLASVFGRLTERRVKEALANKGYLEHLDYALTQKTYADSGVVTLDLTAYNKRVVKTVQKTLGKKFDFDKNSEYIKVATLQASLDNEVTIKTAEGANLGAEFLDFNKKPWVSTENTKIILTRHLMKSDKPFYVDNSAKISSHDFELSLSLDTNFAKENKTVLPVFTFFAKTVLLFAAHNLGVKYGSTLKSLDVEVSFEEGGDGSSSSPGPGPSPKIIARFSVIRDGEEPTKEAIKSELGVAIKHVTGEKRRISRTLRKLNYEFNSSELPEITTIFEETDTIVGNGYWKSFATQKNIIKISKAIQEEVKV